MMKKVYDVIVIGAGHAGLSASYYLKQQNLEHIVFEKGKIGVSWSSQRWDSFVLNTADKYNALPGMETTTPDKFSAAKELVAMYRKYVQHFNLPVEENATVVAVEKSGVYEFSVTIEQDGIRRIYYGSQIIIASGSQNEIVKPALSRKLDSSILQLHASEYRNHDQLPTGAVLVVGSAQTGCQIADDLRAAGKTVYLATSCVARIPRRYRGHDIMDWLTDMKFFDMRREDLPDASMMHMRAPQLTGVGNGKHTISLQSLAKKGVVLLGKMEMAEGKHLLFQSNAAMHVQFADGFSQKVKQMIDEYIAGKNLSIPDSENDESDIPDTSAFCVSGINSLDTEMNNISSVIWASGFGNNLDFIKMPIEDESGELKYDAVHGLHFIGFPWQRNRKSTLLCGIREDAEDVVKRLVETMERRMRRVEE